MWGISNGGLILFDGDCLFCNKSVQFIFKRDRKGWFKFAALQSDLGQKILRDYKLPDKDFTTMIFLKRGKVYTKSSAVLQIARSLDGAWFLVYALSVVPMVIRDGVYNLIAKNRHKLIKDQECEIPSAEIKSRFLT